MSANATTDFAPAADADAVSTYCVLCNHNCGVSLRVRPFELGTETFRRILEHPEGVVVGVLDPEEAWSEQLGWEDRRIRLAPEPMLAEIRRALASDPARPDPDYPIVLATGVRTRWTANAIHREPGWRKGRGPHCAVYLSPADAAALSIENGSEVRVTTRRGSLRLPAEVDPGCQPGSAWMPNGFGTVHVGEDGVRRTLGANGNELTDAADRDPFTGCPHHKGVRCRIEPV